MFDGDRFDGGRVVGTFLRGFGSFETGLLYQRAVFAADYVAKPATLLVDYEVGQVLGLAAFSDLVVGEDHATISIFLCLCWKPPFSIYRKYVT